MYQSVARSAACLGVGDSLDSCKTPRVDTSIIIYSRLVDSFGSLPTGGLAETFTPFSRVWLLSHLPHRLTHVSRLPWLFSGIWEIYVRLTVARVSWILYGAKSREAETDAGRNTWQSYAEKVISFWFQTITSLE